MGRHTTPNDCARICVFVFVGRRFKRWVRIIEQYYSYGSYTHACDKHYDNVIYSNNGKKWDYVHACLTYVTTILTMTGYRARGYTREPYTYYLYSTKRVWHGAGGYLVRRQSRHSADAGRVDRTISHVLDNTYL